MRILITGSKGFIGQNLVMRCNEASDFEVLHFYRGQSTNDLSKQLKIADAVVHLAGELRPRNQSDFTYTNVGLTKTICETLAQMERKIPIIFSSSAQIKQKTPYGRSKLKAEHVIEQYHLLTGAPVIIYRLPGVFGKWGRPNYNSVVATFCHNIARGLPIDTHDTQKKLQLVYVDDVIKSFLGDLTSSMTGLKRKKISPQYRIHLSDLAAHIKDFEMMRHTGKCGRFGEGLLRALYATYVSYLPPQSFACDITRHSDERGDFAEILKTPDCGQFSYFTALPGVIRGEHYHHSKTEKFVVVMGSARFDFRHIVTNETQKIYASEETEKMIETVPGWAHKITNVGQDKMVVLLWANEVFDPQNPDTISCKV